MAKNGFSMSNRVVTETLSGTVTATVEDCGKQYVWQSAGTTSQLTLPALASVGDGWNVKVISSATPENTKTLKVVSADSAKIYGGVSANVISASNGDNAFPDFYPAEGSTTITLASGSNTGGKGKGCAGSYVNIVSLNGTAWIVEGVTAVSSAAAMTTVFS